MTSNRLQDLLDGRAPVLDGGYGWLLQERGLPPGVPAESWNLENPDAIRELHAEYAAAGAAILTTNSFGGSRARLALAGLDDRVTEIDAAAARLAREAADANPDASGRRPLVAGCIGPTGELLEPLGALSVAEAQGMFAEQIRALVDGGADLVLIETMSDLGEAKAAIAAAREVAADLPIAATMSFDTNLRTMMGVDPATAVKELAAAGVDGVGANCGRGPDEMDTIATQLLEAREALGDDAPMLLVQTNAGLPELQGADFVYTVGPDEMAAHAVALRKAGIDAVGSCCGSGPAHTRAIAAAVG